MYPNSLIHWPQSTYIGTTLRPKYILVGYMDPLGGGWRGRGLGFGVEGLGFREGLGLRV